MGAIKVLKLLEYMQCSVACDWLTVQVYNDGSTGILNKDVKSCKLAIYHYHLYF